MPAATYFYHGRARPAPEDPVKACGAEAASTNITHRRLS